MNILGISIALPQQLAFLSTPLGTFGANVIAWLALTLLAYGLLQTTIRRICRFSKTHVDELIISIVQRPLTLLILTYGLLSSLSRAFGDSPIVSTLNSLYRGIVIILLAYVAWRVLYEVIIAHLEPMVRASDSKADDIIIPILRRIGPVIIIIAVANAVVATLGGDLSALLAGLGLLGLVLGYLFQEPLQGLFSGTYMALDNPFHEDDLIILEDGTTCQVIRIGIRVTQLYDVSRHVVQFLPNARLASNKIVNLTKPSVEMRTAISLSFADTCDCGEMVALMMEACNGHENILGDWEDKQAAIARRQAAYHAQLAEIGRVTEPTPGDKLQQDWLEDHIDRLDGELIRLQVEHSLRERASDFSESLANLMRFCLKIEKEGRIRGKLASIQEHTRPVMEEFSTLVEQITVWLYLVQIIETELTDDDYATSLADFVARDLLDDGKLTLAELASCGAPGAPTKPIVEIDDLQEIRSSEAEADRMVDQRLFQSRAGYIDYKRLYAIWHRNIAQIYRGLLQIHSMGGIRADEYGDLSDHAKRIERQFGDAFLLRVSHWQKPIATLKDVNDGKFRYELSFFVDDVVREHFQRSERVTGEVLMEIARLKRAAGLNE